MCPILDAPRPLLFRKKTEQFLLRRAHSNLNLYKTLTPIPFPFSRSDQIKCSTIVGVAHIEIKEP
jgi:hypothetical protein